MTRQSDGDRPDGDELFPSFKGGQGRSSASIERDATAVSLSCMLALLFALYVASRVWGWA